MMMPKVSVIVPVYNVEEYLAECLDSIIHQTLKDIEIICVNDGSTDSSLNLLKEYAARDSRIFIIEQENGGLGHARNVAIKKAKGEYIGFVDSDDWIEINMFQILYDLATKFDTDVTMCELKVFNQHTGIISQPGWFKLPFNSQYETLCISWKEINEVGFKITPGPVNKIYRKDFILKNNLEFATNIYYEDVLFTYSSLIAAKKINFIRKPLYIYRHLRPGSIMQDKGKKHFDIFISLNRLQEAIEKSGKLEELKTTFYTFKFNQYLFHFIEVDYKYKKEFWERIKTEFDSIDKESYHYIFKQSVRSKIALKTIHNFYLFRFCLKSIHLAFRINIVLRDPN